jgi:hypothetical protein
MSMIGMIGPERTGEKIFILVGPITDVSKLDRIAEPDVPVREIRKDGAVFLELGPLGDAVEAMILSEKIRENFSLPVEVKTR